MSTPRPNNHGNSGSSNTKPKKMDPAMSMLVARRKKEKSRPALSITVTKSTTKDESKKGSPTSAQLRHSKIKEKLKKFDTLEEILQKRNGTADDLKSPAMSPMVMSPTFRSKPLVSPRTQVFQEEIAPIPNLDTHIVGQAWEHMFSATTTQHDDYDFKLLSTGASVKKRRSHRRYGSDLPTPKSATRRRSGSRRGGRHRRAWTMGSINNQIVQFGLILSEIMRGQAALDKKGTDLAVAAEIGQTLLSKCNKHQETIDDLTYQNAELQSQNQQLKKECAMFRHHTSELTKVNRELVEAEAPLTEAPRDDILHNSWMDFLRSELEAKSMYTGDTEVDLRNFRRLLRKERMVNKGTKMALEEALSTAADEKQVTDRRIQTLRKELESKSMLQQQAEELRDKVHELSEELAHERVTHATEMKQRTLHLTFKHQQELEDQEKKFEHSIQEYKALLTERSYASPSPQKRRARRFPRKPLSQRSLSGDNSSVSTEVPSDFEDPRSTNGGPRISLQDELAGMDSDEEVAPDSSRPESPEETPHSADDRADARPSTDDEDNDDDAEDDHDKPSKVGFASATDSGHPANLTAASGAVPANTTLSSLNSAGTASAMSSPATATTAPRTRDSTVVVDRRLHESSQDTHNKLMEQLESQRVEMAQLRDREAKLSTTIQTLRKLLLFYQKQEVERAKLEASQMRAARRSSAIITRGGTSMPRDQASGARRPFVRAKSERYSGGASLVNGGSTADRSVSAPSPSVSPQPPSGPPPKSKRRAGRKRQKDRRPGAVQRGGDVSARSLPTALFREETAAGSVHVGGATGGVTGGGRGAPAQKDSRDAIVDPPHLAGSGHPVTYAKAEDEALEDTQEEDETDDGMGGVPVGTPVSTPIRMRNDSRFFSETPEYIPDAALSAQMLQAYEELDEDEKLYLGGVASSDGDSSAANSHSKSSQYLAGSVSRKGRKKRTSRAGMWSSQQQDHMDHRFTSYGGHRVSISESHNVVVVDDDEIGDGTIYNQPSSATGGGVGVGKPGSVASSSSGHMDMRLPARNEAFPGYTIWGIFSESIQSNRRIDLKDKRLVKMGLSKVQLVILCTIFRVAKRQWDLAVHVVRSLRRSIIKQVPKTPTSTLTRAVPFELPEPIPDEKFSHCSNCQKEFWLFTRRHHCRLCGAVFCYDCCFKKPDIGQLIERTRHATGWKTIRRKQGLRLRTCELCAVVVHCVERHVRPLNNVSSK